MSFEEKRRRRPAFLLVPAALLAVSATVAWATIPGPGGKIQGCYKSKGGQLRVVSKPSQCKKSEKALAWNVRGPKGDPGPQGPKGDPGLQGPKGDPGAAGSALAFARVNADGTLSTTESKNVLDVRRPADGNYCFKLGFRPQNAVGSADPTTIRFPVLVETTTAALSVCPTEFRDAAAILQRSTSGAPINAGFFILFN